jgi:hypothetical protein
MVMRARILLFHSPMAGTNMYQCGEGEHGWRRDVEDADFV